MSYSRILTASFILAAFLFTAQGAGAGGIKIPGIDELYWQQQADYTIKCDLDPANHMLSGTQTVKYTNNSPDTLRSFFMHLYPDAYRDKDSALLRDFYPATWKFFMGLAKSNRGWIDIKAMKVDGREVEFTVDGTILSCSFPDPLPPGAWASIELSFDELVRKKLGRAGYVGDHYDIAQWYPKMVVYDKNGWHPDQFRMGEFYGEFGNYDVHITIPSEFVIASTGVLVAGDAGWDKNRPVGSPGQGEGSKGRPGGYPGGHPGPENGKKEDTSYGQPKTVHFHAENVHDFAWSADPYFIVEKAEHNGYDVMSFYRPWNRSWADSALARGIRSMKWMESFAGPYGYPQMSIVDSPSHGGMEYPMLVMNGSSDEYLILHEIGHNWFYGMLANDEREEAWLDEGLTQYQMFRNAEERFGPYGEKAGRNMLSWFNPPRKLWDGLSREVISYHRSGFAERVATPHHEFRNAGHAMVYLKGALFIRALRYYVGEKDFNRIIHTYFERWKFKHVDEESLLSVSEEVSGLDLDEFFKQWLHTTKDCDYKLARFKVKEKEGNYEAEVKVKREGEMMMPITLAFRFDDGNTLTERIDGMPREYTNTFSFPRKPVSLSINPDNEILDIYMLDNFSPRRRSLRIDIPVDRNYPSDAFQYLLLPVGYYNDIDGGKAGLRIRGSYDDIYKKFTLQGIYGFESELLDVYGLFEHPIGYLGREAVWHSSGYYREGRKGVDLAIRKTRRKDMSEPMAKNYTLGFSYQELFDPEYVYPGTYEEGKNMRSSFLVTMFPKTDIFAASFLAGLDRSFWGSDFNYEKYTLSAAIVPHRYWPLFLRPKIRAFFGRATMDPPLQEMFSLAGAGVLEKEKYFWLRSVGAFWEDYYGNFHVPGEGNLRGYYNADYSFKSILTSNIEIDFPLPLPMGRKMKRKTSPSIFLFYDAGKVFDSRPMEFLPVSLQGVLDEDTFDGVIQDFGIGVKFWRITAEFPFYLSHPALSGDEEKWDYRWTIGFDSLF